MLGFSWLSIRQAQEALKNGRLEDARQLLGQPGFEGHKRAFELLAQVARAYTERGERHLHGDDVDAAWNDLAAAEQLGADGTAAAKLRQNLIGRGLVQARALVEAGEASRAAEVIAQLRSHSVQQPELLLLEEAGKAWLLAREQAGRGEFAPAIQTAGRIPRLMPGRQVALEEFVATLERRQQTFAALLMQLHGAVHQKDWREVVRLSEQVLAMAPEHLEARKARTRAWRAIEPQTVAHERPRPEVAVPANGKPVTAEPRYLLWVDGVGGFLVCMGNRVTIGQATPESHVDIPLYADVSRLHASLTRDSEGYLLEATRPVQVNGRTVERALLRSHDRLTLGNGCQIQFSQPVPVSATARLDVRSGHRLALAVDGILLMADTLVLGPGSQAHVTIPDLDQAVILFRQKDGLAVRYGGNLSVDGQRCKERGLLRPNSTVTGDDFAFAIEPVGTGLGRV